MMMPKHYHPDDDRWIRQQMRSLPTAALRQRAAKGYSKAYEIARDTEPRPHCKDGAARFAANTRLRRFVARVCTSN